MKRRKEMDLQQAYHVMQAASGIGVGDTVKILRKATSNEMGWNVAWMEEMDKTVGMYGKVIEVDCCSGIHVCILEPFGNYFFPFFILEVVEKGNFPTKRKEKAAAIRKHVDKQLPKVYAAIEAMEVSESAEMFHSLKKNLLLNIVRCLPTQDIHCIYCPSEEERRTADLPAFCKSCKYGEDHGICSIFEVNSSYSCLIDAIASLKAAISEY